MKDMLKMLAFGLITLSVFSILPAQAAAEEVPPEVREVKDCFAGKTMASNKLECVFNETFITYFLIPAILVFAIVYGLVKKIGFFKSDAIEVLIGLGFALLVMFNAEQLSIFGNFISDLGPGPMMLILFLLAIIAMAMKEEGKG